MISSTMKMARIDWLLDRRKGIGGSDVSAILGLNKWKSAYQIWLEKTGKGGSVSYTHMTLPTSNSVVVSSV